MGLMVKKIEELMRQRGHNYKSLSLAAKLGETAVRDILVGRSVSPQAKTLDKLARALGVSTSDLFSDADTPQIPIVANVGAGAEVFPLDDMPLYRHGLRESDKPYANCETAEVPPGYTASEVLAVRIKGDSMLPFMPEGTIVYYSTRNAGGVSECIKKLCVVQTKNGAVYLKILKKGEQHGRYNLMSYNASEIENVEIEWAAKVVFVKMG